MTSSQEQRAHKLFQKVIKASHKSIWKGSDPSRTKLLNLQDQVSALRVKMEATR